MGKAYIPTDRLICLYFVDNMILYEKHFREYDGATKVVWVSSSEEYKKELASGCFQSQW